MRGRKAGVVVSLYARALQRFDDGLVGLLALHIHLAENVVFSAFKGIISGLDCRCLTFANLSQI